MTRKRQLRRLQRPQNHNRMVRKTPFVSAVAIILLLRDSTEALRLRGKGSVDLEDTDIGKPFSESDTPQIDSSAQHTRSRRRDEETNDTGERLYTICHGTASDTPPYYEIQKIVKSDVAVHFDPNHATENARPDALPGDEVVIGGEQGTVQEDCTVQFASKETPAEILSEYYAGILNCADHGYDFGMQMNHCVAGNDISVASLDRTPFHPDIPEGECDVTELGEITIICSDRDMDNGGLPRQAVVTPSRDNTVVMIQGDVGGTLYAELKAGETYSLDVGSAKSIRDIEFCFLCGPIETAAPTEFSTQAQTIQLNTEVPTNSPTIEVIMEAPAGPPSTQFKGVLSCADRGFDFGLQMDHCVAANSMPFDALSRTPFHSTVQDPDACQMGNELGSFDVMCTEQDTENGGHPRKVVITPSVNATVMVQGEGGGLVYENLLAGSTYVLESGLPSGVIDVEFCFFCSDASSSDSITIAPSPPSPTPAPTDAPITTNEGDLVYTPYQDVRSCSQQGYDFGMQLEYCVPGQDITVDNLGQTPFRAGIDQASCRVNNIGTFTIACSERDMDSGGLPAKATITPSFNSAVMIQGEHGGTLYESMVAGKTYSLDIGQPNAIRDIEFCFTCSSELVRAPISNTASSFGDPHIKTWGGGHFDFHGGCDLILVKSDDFGGGLGFDIHIRTKVRTWWSYIETAVLRIGDDTLEVQGGTDNITRFWVNGIQGHTDQVVDGGYLKSTLAGHKIHFRDMSARTKQFRIDWNGEDSISLETFGDFVRVNVRANKNSKNFAGAVGLMGSYPTGSKLGRDGEHLIWNTNQFGQEWQVRHDEPKLFRTYDGVLQHPEKCLMPHTMRQQQGRGRRLEELLSQEAVESACAHVANQEDFQACVYDVRATNDVETAGLYEFII